MVESKAFITLPAGVACADKRPSSERRYIALQFLALGALFYLTSLPVTAVAKEFECKNAAMPMDFVICANPDLFEANRALATVWDTTWKGLNETGRKSLVRDQRAWITDVNTKCGLPTRGKPTDEVIRVSKSCVLREIRGRANSLGSLKTWSEFNIEEDLPRSIEIPPSVLAAINDENDISQCLAERGTSPSKALEGQSLSLNPAVSAFLLKPRANAGRDSGWGCICGTYLCPIWVYRIDREDKAKLIWSYPTANVKVLTSSNKGYPDIFEVGGSAGHTDCSTWAWNGQAYERIKEAHIEHGPDGDEGDSKACDDPEP